MSQPLIVKLGSAVTRAANLKLDQAALQALISQCGELMSRGQQVVLVSSGAVAAGREILTELTERNPVVRRQLYAAVGQNELMQYYREAFAGQGRSVAQILATRQDFATRRHYLNLRECLLGALRAGIVPVVNENDVVSVTELMFTDNDELAGLLAAMLGASKLIMLSNVDGVFDRPPTDPDSQLIRQWGDRPLQAFAGNETSEFGRGGIQTKVRSAVKLAELGTEVWIANGRRPAVLLDAAAGSAIGTRFSARRRASPSRRWVAAATAGSASVSINGGAVEALRCSQRLTSLLPVGIMAVDGAFERGDIIRVVGPEGQAIGYGRAEYGSEAATRALGRQRQKPLIHYDYLFVESDHDACP